MLLFGIVVQEFTPLALQTICSNRSQITFSEAEPLPIALMAIGAVGRREEAFREEVVVVEEVEDGKSHTPLEQATKRYQLFKPFIQ